jgi:hypothetical protein
MDILDAERQNLGHALYVVYLITPPRHIEV